MKIISDKETYNENVTIVEKFNALYVSNFPDPDEREDFDIIISRIVENSYFTDPKTFLILCDEGGMVVEFYYSCKSVLLTYIVVNKAYRGKGIAKMLLTDGIEQISKLIQENAHVNINAIFFESNNPKLTDFDSFDPVIRLQIFKSLGAKYIDIPYVQPSLGTGKEKVKNLFLFTLPLPDRSLIYLETQIIRNFLKSFYIELGTAIPEKDTDFREMISAIDSLDKDGLIYLSEVPTFYIPRLSFKNVAISFHRPCIASVNSDIECNFIKSYELDLFSYLNQERIPFTSKCLRPYDPAVVEIELSNNIVFTSEGRREILCSKNETFKALVYPVFTRFKSGEGVATLTLRPFESFSEIELIYLTSIFGSKQEQSNLRDNIRIISNGHAYSLDEFYSFLFSEYAEFDGNYKNLTGSVDIDISDISVDKPEIITESLFKLFQGIELDDPESIFGLQEEYNLNPEVEYLLNVLCGVVLGIFDFNRMGIDEVLDTLIPINASSNSFMLVNRGCFAEICQGGLFQEEIIHFIGISPYLIIPNILLTHTEYCWYNAKKVLEMPFDSVEQNINALEDSISSSIEYMNRVEKDVFQYPSEKVLFETGSKQRNLDLVAKITMDTLSKSRTALSKLLNRRKDKYDTFVSVILIIISVFQVESIVRTLIQLVFGDGTISKVDLLSMASISFLIIAAILVFFIGKRVSTGSDKENP